MAILGVGNRLRGDDAVGCILCDKFCTDAEKNSPPRHQDTKKSPEGSEEQGRNSPPRHKDTEGPSAESSIVHRPSSVPEETGTVPASPALGDLDALGGSSLGDSVFVLDCGSTPENYIQPVADRNPTRILVVDCCAYEAKPGEFRLFSRTEIEQLSYGLLSTHTLPLTLTIEMLSLQTHATIELLGIQPERIEFGEDLSEPVQRALPAVVEFVRNWAHQSQPV